MMPAVYALSRGDLAAVPMDASHRAEMALSFAMTLYGCACLVKLRYPRANAICTFILWTLSFAAPAVVTRGHLGGCDVRWSLAVLLVLLAVLEVTFHRREIDVAGSLRSAFAAVRTR